MVLVVSLLVMLVLSLLGAGLLQWSVTEDRLTRRQAAEVQALYLAHLAVERAVAELNRRLDADPAKADFDPELLTNDGYLFGSGGGYAAFVVGAHQVGLYRTRLTIAEAGPGAPGLPRGTLWLAGEGVVTAAGQEVTRRSKRVAARLGPASPVALIMGCTDGTDALAISGNPTFGGSNGSVHSNCHAAVSGNPTIARNLTASGTLATSGHPTVLGRTAAGVPPLRVPAIQPATYRSLADYLLRETASPPSAHITRPDGTLVFDATGGGVWPASSGGWQYTGTPGVDGKWQYVNARVPPEVQGKTFYVEKAPGSLTGNAVIGGNPGTGDSPWQVTLVAEGHIEISGNPAMRPQSRNLLLIAGTDVKISGNPSASASEGAVIAAREQIALSGNMDLVGMVLAENAAGSDPFVSATTVSGNPRVTYDGRPASPLPWGFGLRILSWREPSD